MRKSLIAGVAALSIAAIPALAAAQVVSASPDATTSSVQDKRGLAPDHEAELKSWPEEQQQVYWSWEPTYQDYYWTLTAQQRAQAWADYRAAVAKSKQTPATIYVNKPMVQAIAEGRSANYPVCQGAVQDECINPREAGMDWGNRPLAYWPGKPASEM